MGLQSGNNWNVNHIKSELTMIQDFVFDAGNAVQFNWRVNSETCWYGRCDGFAFFVDNQRVLPPPSSAEPLYSQQLQFVTFTYNLTKGLHLLQWVYEKDGWWSGGEDKAYIKYINLIGASASDHVSPSACRACGTGLFSNTSAATSCQQCGWFQYQGSANGTQCLPCDADSAAAPGSATCEAKPACTESDYYLAHTPVSGCVLNAQGVYVGNHTYTWEMVGASGASHKVCSGGTLPPPLLDAPCLCDPGYYITVAEGDTLPSCQPCPSNTYSNGTQPACQPCGQYQLPTLALAKTSWSEPIAESCDDPGCLSSTCSGDCSSAWVPRGSYVSSGRTLGVVSSQLLINNIAVPGQARMSLVCWLLYQGVAGGQYSLSISISNSSGYVVYSTDCTACPFCTAPSCPDLANTCSWTAPYGDSFTIAADFVQATSPADAQSFAEARIYSLASDSVLFGGAVGCQGCGLGSYYAALGDDASCQPCQPGQQSTVPPSDTCVACGGNTFNAISGNQCMACGNATSVVLPGRTSCDIHGCSFVGQLSQRLYNLTALSHPGGNMFFAGQTPQYQYPPVAPHVYYINPCSTSHAPTSCVDAQNQSLPYMTCQTTQDAVYDLGSVLGYWENAVGDITLQFRGGSSSRCGKPRTADLHLICDPTVGLGLPDKQAGQSKVEISTCVYGFEWRSLYACPVCRDQDFIPLHGVCQNGQQRQFYVTSSSCVGSKPDTTVPCRTPSASDLPDQGHVFVTASVNLFANVTADLFPSELAAAFRNIVPVSSILVVTVNGDSVFFRMDILAYQTSVIQNVTASLASVVASAGLGALVGAPSVVNAPAPAPPAAPTSAPSSSSSSSSKYVAPVVIIVIIALSALVTAGVFYWKNRQLRYQNYRLVKESGQDNGIANELYDEDSEEPPVLRPTGGGMRFLNQAPVNALYGDDDDEALS